MATSVSNFRNESEPILCACICVSLYAMVTLMLTLNAVVTMGTFRIKLDPANKEHEDAKETDLCKQVLNKV